MEKEPAEKDVVNGNRRRERNRVERQSGGYDNRAE